MAIVVLAAVVAPAAAHDLGHAVRPHAGTTGGPADAHSRTSPVQLARTWSAALPRQGTVGGLRDETMHQRAGSVDLRPRRRERQSGIAWPWRSHGRSDLAVPLTQRLFLGLGYRYLEGEDLRLEFAEAGAADYNSHQLLIRAHWRF